MAWKWDPEKPFQRNRIDYLLSLATGEAELSVEEMRAAYGHGSRKGSGRNGGANKPKIPDRVRIIVYRRARGRCYYCECAVTQDGTREATIDHKRPRSRGGTNDLSNLVLACWTCNQDKGSMTVEEYRMRNVR